MLKSFLISVTEFQTKPDVPWCSLGAASLLKTSRWRLKETQRHPAKAMVQRGHRSRGESGWREYTMHRSWRLNFSWYFMDLMLLLLARSVGGTNQGLAIYCQPMLGMVSVKMQELYLLDDCFFFGLRTSLLYCPTACHSPIQPVGLRMREGEPGCVDLGLGCREHMEVDWIGMKWDSFPCRKTNSEMKVSWHGYPKSSSCGWPWLRNSHHTSYSYNVTG